MCDCAIFLCCLNLFRIYCLEYTCLIISIIIFPLNVFGIFMIKWEVIKLFCEIIYSINIPISIFVIFLISLILYSTKIGKINTSELNKPFTYISIMSICLSIYVFLSYSFCSYQIFKDYLTFVKKNNSKNSSSIENEILNTKLKVNITWIFLSISTLLPNLLSFINIFLWISIYYRISFKIYCSFNKEIRKELREQKKTNKQFKHLEENNFNYNINNNKNKDFLKNFVSIVIEKKKDRHRVSTRFLSNGGIYTKNTKNINKQDNSFSNKKHQNFNPKEFNQTDNISSERNLKKVVNKIHS